MLDGNKRIDFFIPKLKFFVLLIIVLAVSIPLLILAIYMITEREFTLFFLSLFFASPFTVASIIALQKLTSSKPFLSLTEEGLIVKAYSPHAILIAWEDIIAYSLIRSNMSLFIQPLFDYNHYFSSMSRETKKLYHIKNDTGRHLFSFSLGHIKRKERDFLIAKLDQLAETYPNLTNRINPPKNKVKGFDRINQKYFIHSYIYSFLFSMIAFVFWFMVDGNVGALILIIFQFIFYPFAKLIFDVLIGFKVRDVFNQPNAHFNIFAQQFISLLNILVYIATIILAPIGILYLVTVKIYRLIKNK